jgi:hypothetical protein
MKIRRQQLSRSHGFPSSKFAGYRTDKSAMALTVEATQNEQRPGSPLFGRV